MQIEDGTGSGNAAKINSENMMYVSAVTLSAERHANQEHGHAYHALFAVNPDGTDDCIFYLKNNSNMDIVIEGIWWQTSGAEEVYYKVGDIGTAIKTNGTDITPANLNAGSGNIADVTCYSNVGDGAVDITGLSGGITIQKLWLTSAETKCFNSEQDIIVPKNQTFTVYCIGGDTMLRGTVVFNFHNNIY